MMTNSDNPEENLSKKNISIAFKLSDFYGEDNIYAPEFGYLYFSQYDVRIKEKMNGEQERDIVNWEIPFSSCKLGKNFFFDNSTTANKYNIHKFYCPDWKNLTL